MPAAHRPSLFAALTLAFALLGAAPVTATDDPDASADVLLRQIAEINQRISDNASDLEQSAEQTRRVLAGKDVESLETTDLLLAPLPEVPPGADPLAIMTAKMTRYINTSIAVSNRYRAELAAIPIEAFLAPQTYANEEGFAMAAKRMARAELAYARMARALRAATQAFAEDMRSDDLPSEAIEGFNATFQDGGKMEEHLAAEGRLLAHIGTMVAFIVAQRPEVQGDAFLFRSQEGVTAYNAHLAELAELIEQQAAMTREGQARLDEVATQLETRR
jgi:hypothetical protein